MECKMESAARTAIRMEVLYLQGLLRAVFLFLLEVSAMPFIPFMLTFGIWVSNRKEMPWWKRTALIPVWFVGGIFYALLMPFTDFWTGIVQTYEVLKVEWALRWTTGVPKMPDGSPARILTEKEQRYLEAARMYGVLKDYNEEAQEHGQGVDIPPLG